MSQFITEALIQNGHLELKDIPLQDGLAVKVIIAPQADLSKMSFPEIWKNAQSIRGKLASEISQERDER